MTENFIELFQNYHDQLTSEEIYEQNLQRVEDAKKEHEEFLSFHENDMCYICKKSYKTISKENPCVHWLLREGKFKKKDFKSVYVKFDYFQINAYLRWIANSAEYLKNINDMKDEQTKDKVIQETIKYKHIEWSFECSNGDFKGHGGSQSDFPHYHFQMRLSGQQFINYSDFHIPFIKDDLMKLTLMKEKNPNFGHTFGSAGAGMENVMNMDVNKIFNSSDYKGNELNGVIHFSSIIQAPGGIDGILIDEAYAESKRTGKSVAKIMRDKLKNEKDISMISIGSPVESVPSIAKRTEHNKKQNKTKGK